MKRALLLLLATCTLVAPACSQSTNMGARQLVVRVLSTRKLGLLSIAPLHEGETMRACRSCRPQPLEVGTLAAKADGDRIELSTGKHLHQLYLEGALRIQAGGDQITAAGNWILVAQNNQLRLLLTLDSERYVALALSGETAPGEPVESLKAMAVAVRTYALENAGRHAAEGFDFCDSTHCQALRFGPVTPLVREAVVDTAGETLWSSRRRATVFYTQNCGGQTEDVRNVWPASEAPNLSSHPDPYCVRHGAAVWHTDIPLAQVQRILRAQGWKTPAHFESVRIAARTSSGRARELEFSGDGTKMTVSASSFRFAVNRALGWNQVRSDWFEISIGNAALHIDGRGYGHGVGLCQAGAREMALEGRNYHDILSFYFPDTRVGITPQQGGWRTLNGNGWTWLTPSYSTAGLQQGNLAWARARSLFPPRTPVSPVVRQFPSTELFRQSSNEPGWVLGAARGLEIYLQPGPVLARNGSADDTLLHEFLHVLVEQEAAPQAQLWLREGLVEALTDEPSAAEVDPRIDFGALDFALVQPRNQPESRRAHAAAAKLTRALLANYGLQQVREWLTTTGVPNSVIAKLQLRLR